MTEPAVQEAIDHAMTRVGVDIENPQEMRADFVALREIRIFMTDRETQADLVHLRKWRKSLESMQSKGMLAAVGFLITGLLALAWAGVTSKLGFGG